MRTYSRQVSGKIRIGDSLAARVLEITGSRVKLGFEIRESKPFERSAGDALWQVGSNCRGYYRFSRDTDRVLILELNKGQRVAVTQSMELVVLELRRAGVTFAICSD